MARVYLETSFFSACVSTRTTTRSLYWREVSNEWWTFEAPRHDLVVSGEVIAELSDPAFPQRDQALTMVKGLPSLEISDEVIGLAEVLVKEKVMPGPVAGDALHVAAATWHSVEFLLTWNVKHLANPNKRTHLGTVCLRLGLVPPTIVTPDLLRGLNDD
ncbi:MAG: type II toxin-antitoxin system VapC family toxin [Phycisphaerae bacterium]|nr:type II toxin-antitoxin system VapC family toxin [Phycisphaerae bacterium]